MKPFLNKDIPSFLFFGSLTVFGVFLALVVLGKQTDKEQLGAILGMASMFLAALSLYFTISNRNKSRDKL